MLRGPLLYLIYVIDIDIATSGQILSFADDTSLFLSNSNLDILFHDANIEITNYTIGFVRINSR